MKTIKEYAPLIVFGVFLILVFVGMCSEAQEIEFGENTCKVEVEITKSSLFYPYCLEEMLDRGPKKNREWIIMPPGCLMVIIDDEGPRPYQDHDCWIIFKNKMNPKIPSQGT